MVFMIKEMGNDNSDMDDVWSGYYVRSRKSFVIFVLLVLTFSPPSVCYNSFT